MADSRPERVGRIVRDEGLAKALATGRFWRMALERRNLFR